MTFEVLKPSFCIVILCIFSCLGFLTITLDAYEESSENLFIHHDIRVVLYPQENRFQSEDSITVTDLFSREFRFLIHKGLNPTSLSQGVRISRDTGESLHQSLESYRVVLPHGVKSFVISYGGLINHPLEQIGKEQARGYSQTIGKIAEEGVYLSGHSHWYPVLNTALLTFSLTVELPSRWDAVSQGERTYHQKDDKKTVVTWSSPEPQEEIFLVAGKFHEYSKQIVRSSPNFSKGGVDGITYNGVQAMVFLREPDKELADRYLDATVRCVSMYEKMLGTYPYKKFALVENFWETGFGMPSFTLLGSKVIRFPFIIKTSYPHEILHTWWGNSVFPDYEQGNWAEGLTAYLSDHLNAEQRGEDSDYRQTTLQKYTDYVSGGRDFPLTEFRSRHSASTEAIGYGKSLMFFHMLRVELGDETFMRGLRDFYENNKFHFASFRDLRRSFEKVSGRNLSSIFSQWITQPGAPEIKVSNIDVHAERDTFVLTGSVEQTQEGQVYHFFLPLAVTMEGQKEAYQTELHIEKKQTDLKVVLPKRPLRIDFDPQFDIFRRLSRDEIPPAITQVLGAKKLLVILPSGAKPPLLEAYRDFAEALGNSGPDQVEIQSDRQISSLPSDGAICILGRENGLFEKTWRELSRYGLRIDEEKVQIMQSEVPFAGHAMVLTGRNPANRDEGMLLVTFDNPEVMKGLSRKLPHYHKYSYLAFRGDEVENILKGRWPVTNSPMIVFLPGTQLDSSSIDRGLIRKRTPLSAISRDFSPDRMMGTIRFLASDEMKGRGLGSRELDRAAEYIAQQFREAGLKPAGDFGASYFQTWEEKEQAGKPRTMKNVVGVILGKKSGWSSQSVVVGAHYDHLGTVRLQDGPEQTYHGADDNASGIAVLLELARVLSSEPAPERSIVFAAFTAEESGRKGSKYYLAHQKRYPADQIIGMLNVDTVGRLGNNKLLILGSGSAKEWEHIMQGASHQTGVGVELVSEELDSSDQRSFQEARIPAVQFFSGPHTDYHKPTDTAEKIDEAGLIKVASMIKEVIGYLAKRETPLTVTLSSDQTSVPDHRQERRVSFGIIPDFGYHGEGCRLSGVVKGSQADKAGLRGGDIITGINSQVVHSLKDVADILKRLNPGDDLSIAYIRDGKKMTAKGSVSQRQ